jgi:hypothetical protein
VSEAEFAEFTAHYYTSGSPEKAGRMLEYFISEKLETTDEVTRPLVAYVFSRIARTNPSVLRNYEALFDKTSAGGRSFILRILELDGDAKTQEFLSARLQDKKFARESAAIGRLLETGFPVEFDVFKRDVRQGTDLDYLWAEFTVTGNTQAVLHIIDVLERPDRVREKLQSWMERRSLLDKLPWSQYQRRRTQKQLLDIVGIVLKPAQQKIETPEDLDTLCLLQELESSKERFQKVRAALPFALLDEDLVYIATKAAAKWSLGSNAKQHPLVLELLERESGRRSGRSKLALLEIVAQVYVARGEFGQAASKLRQYLDLNPLHPGLKEKLLLAAAELNLALLMELSTRTARKESSDLPEAKMIAQRCIEATEKAGTYRSRLVVRDLSEEALKARNHLVCDWQVSFARPDSYRVNQAAWDEGLGEVFDEWITIGTEHYQNVGFWLKASLKPDRRELNRFLEIQKYLALLRTEQPTAVAVYRLQNSSYHLLQYTPGALRGFEAFGDGNKGPFDVEIWIDSTTGQLAKARVLISGHQSGKEHTIELQQVFTSYGEDIKILPPREVAAQ